MTLKNLVPPLIVLSAACQHLGETRTTALDVRILPTGALHSYELDRSHEASSLLVHNIAVVNTGATPVEITSVELELRSDGRALDRRTLGREELAHAATRGAQLQAAGLLEPLAFLFGGEELLPTGATLAPSTQLARGQALLLSNHLFGYCGPRDEFVVRAIGDGARCEVRRAISSSSSNTVFALPVRGVWFDGAGASLHTPHRWVPMEQFAHDLLRLGGPQLKSFRTDGRSFADYYAYGEPVYAAAAGTVVAMADSEGEDESAMRGAGESMDAYMQRLEGEQMARLSRGVLGVAGNYVVIEHAGGEHSFYAHLKPGSVAVRVGQKLALGDRIGAVGSSGNSTEPHLHFQVCSGPDFLMSPGIPPTWRSLGFAFEDFPRASQSGDLIYDLQTPHD